MLRHLLSTRRDLMNDAHNTCKDLSACGSQLEPGAESIIFDEGVERSAEVGRGLLESFDEDLGMRD